MAGRRRQETRCGRPRGLPPPALPNGGVRRGGSNVPKRFRRSSGRIRWVRSGRPAAGCGKGRHAGKAAGSHLRFGFDSGAGRPGMAAARPTLAEAGSACVVARIELRLLVQGPDGALTPSPGIGPEAPAVSAAGAASIAAPGPEARGPVIPNWTLSWHRVPRGRRTKMACRGRPVCGPGTCSRGAGGRSCGRRSGLGRGRCTAGARYADGSGGAARLRVRAGRSWRPADQPAGGKVRLRLPGLGRPLRFCPGDRPRPLRHGPGVYPGLAPGGRRVSRLRKVASVDRGAPDRDGCRQRPGGAPHRRPALGPVVVGSDCEDLPESAAAATRTFLLDASWRRSRRGCGTRRGGPRRRRVEIADSNRLDPFRGSAAHGCDR